MPRATKRRAPLPLASRRTVRRPPKAKIYKPLALREHSFVERTAPAQLAVANEAAASGFYRTYNLDQILQVANYKNIFEFYRIDKVVCHVRYKGASTPAYTTVPASSDGDQVSYPMEIKNEICPVVYYKVDHNDDVADSLNTLKESMRTKEIQLTNDKPSCTIVLKPAIQAEAYKTLLTQGYMPKWGQWLSTNDSTVPHFGLKLFVVAGVGNNANMGDVEITHKVYFTCKNND